MDRVGDFLSIFSIYLTNIIDKLVLEYSIILIELNLSLPSVPWYVLLVDLKFLITFPTYKICVSYIFIHASNFNFFSILLNKNKY